MNSPRITLALAGEGTRPEIIGSHLRSGDMRDYVPIRAGSFSFYILKGDVEPGEAPVPVEEKLLSKVSQKIDGGTYSTLVVTESDGSFSVKALEDLPANKKGPLVRILNFTTSKNLEVTLLTKDGEKAFWKASAPEVIPPLAAGHQATFQLCEEKESGLVKFSTYEFLPTQDLSCSLVIFTNRYGSFSFIGTANAQATIDPEYLKTIASKP